MPIQYKTGDVTRPTESGTVIIAHICHDGPNCWRWGKGVVLSVKRTFPGVQEKFKRWAYSVGCNLGRAQIIDVGNDTHLCNMIGQKGIKSKKNKRPFNDAAVRKCLAVVREFAIANQATICMPKIGSDLGGAD